MVTAKKPIAKLKKFAMRRSPDAKDGVMLCVYREQDRAFYADMGHFFANRTYAAEMGGWQFYTKPGSIWFVAYIGGDVVGFCSAILEKTHWFYDNFYVLPQFRGIGIASKLHELRNNEIMPMMKEIRLIVNHPAQIHKFEQYGFIQSGNRGRYRVYKWHPNTNAGDCAAGETKTKPMESKRSK